MQIKLCTDKSEWNNWFLEQKQAEFLQSWQWGEFQEQTGKKALRLQVFEGKQVSGQLQGFVHTLGLGLNYVYFPRIWNLESGIMTEVIGRLKKKNFVFIRIENCSEISNIPYSTFHIPSRQPQTTLILDLTKSEDELLQAMHSKTRYNIRLAERKGVKVKQEKDIEVFWKLNQETIERDKFKSYAKEYYQKMLNLGICHQLTAYYNDKPIAANLLISFADTCTYLHGASSNEHKNLMAPYLLQWEGIKLAKKLNCKYYDLWGIAPQKKEGEGQTTCFNNFCWQADHKWMGITRFKVGFGGEVKEYPAAMDVMLNLWLYKLYKLARKLRGLASGATLT